MSFPASGDGTWQSPYPLVEPQRPEPPDGSGQFPFLMCMTPGEYAAMQEALFYGRLINDDLNDLTAMWPFLQAQAYIGSFWQSPCWNDLLCGWVSSLHATGKQVLQAIDTACGSSLAYTPVCEAVADCAAQTAGEPEAFALCMVQKAIAEANECIGFVPPVIQPIPTLCEQLNAALGANPTQTQVSAFLATCGITMQGSAATTQIRVSPNDPRLFQFSSDGTNWTDLSVAPTYALYSVPANDGDNTIDASNTTFGNAITLNDPGFGGRLIRVVSQS